MFEATFCGKEHDSLLVGTGGCRWCAGNCQLTAAFAVGFVRRHVGHPAATESRPMKAAIFFSYPLQFYVGRRAWRQSSRRSWKRLRGAALPWRLHHSVHVTPPGQRRRLPSRGSLLGQIATISVVLNGRVSVVLNSKHCPQCEFPFLVSGTGVAGLNSNPD